jgi:hypothetical protein
VKVSIKVKLYIEHFIEAVISISNTAPMLNPMEIIPGDTHHTEGVQGSDALLASYLKAMDEEQAESMLGTLLWEHARPLIKNIVSTNLRFSTSYTSRGRYLEDLEDLIGGVTLQLLKRFRGIRENAGLKAITSFRDYVAVAAYNACYEYLRQKSPARTRLKDKLRYILTRRQGLALWEAENKRWCGLAIWEQKGLLKAEKVSLEGLVEARGNAEKQRLVESARTKNLVEFVEDVFHTFSHPIEFNQLVSLVAELTDVKEALLIGDDEMEATGRHPQLVSSKGTDPGALAVMRSQLTHLWREICELPLAQRRVLMFGLRDKNGSSMTVLLADIQIASIRQIAAALALLPEELADLWKRLPLVDTEIAGYLQITRDQVIHQRQSARRRLARRMQLFQ